MVSEAENGAAIVAGAANEPMTASAVTSYDRIGKALQDALATADAIGDTLIAVKIVECLSLLRRRDGVDGR